MTRPAPDHSQTVTFADQLLNRDALQGSAVCLDKLSISRTASSWRPLLSAATDERSLSRRATRPCNYLLRRSKVTRLQLVVDDPFLFGIQINVHG